MEVTWLGQAGLYLQMEGVHIVVDPYFSDSVGNKDPKKKRRIPVDKTFFDIPVDVLLFTHDHLDHYDPETAERYLDREREITVLAPGTCWQKARQQGGAHNYILFNEGTEWTQKGIRFIAIPAVHSDPYAIGVVIQSDTETVYITGDTLYSIRILSALPERIDVIFLPVNGAGNNMNPVDAVRFAKKSGAKIAVPLHVGTMDDLDCSIFKAENRRILKVYEQTKIGVEE